MLCYSFFFDVRDAISFVKHEACENYEEGKAIYDKLCDLLMDAGHAGSVHWSEDGMTHGQFSYRPTVKI